MLDLCRARADRAIAPRAQAAAIDDGSADGTSARARTGHPAAARRHSRHHAGAPARAQPDRRLSVGRPDHRAARAGVGPGQRDDAICLPNSASCFSCSTSGCISRCRASGTRAATSSAWGRSRSCCADWRSARSPRPWATARTTPSSSAARSRCPRPPSWSRPWPSAGSRTARSALPEPPSSFFRTSAPSSS